MENSLVISHIKGIITGGEDESISKVLAMQALGFQFNSQYLSTKHKCAVACL